VKLNGAQFVGRMRTMSHKEANQDFIKFEGLTPGKMSSLAIEMSCARQTEPRYFGYVHISWTQISYLINPVREQRQICVQRLSQGELALHHQCLSHRTRVPLSVKTLLSASSPNNAMPPYVYAQLTPS
jgi:hypothetical protein